MSRNVQLDLPADLDFTKSDAVAILNDRFRRMTGSISGARSRTFGGGAGTGGALTGVPFIYYEQTLTADSVAVPVVATAGSIVAVLIFQDATGGWVLTWPAAFVGMSGFVDSTVALSYTAALFYTADGVTFQLIAAPITGVL